MSLVLAARPEATPSDARGGALAQARAKKLTSFEDPRQTPAQLRAKLRWLSTSSRECACGRTICERVDEGGPRIEIRRVNELTRAGKVNEVQRARWRGLVTCRHIWTCPVCSAALKTERAVKVVRAVEELGGRWQMLTVTLRHRLGMPLKLLFAKLREAWRRTRQGGKIQRIWRGRVSASIRSFEVTYGENGWHPHVHVLLRTTEWSEDEQQALLERWQLQIERALGSECRPDDLHALAWSTAWHPGEWEGSERAAYLAKLGFEATGIGKSRRSPWSIARDAADGSTQALILWREYASSTRRVRAIELDDRAAKAAKRAEEKEPIREHEGEAKPREIPVSHEDVQTLSRAERFIPGVWVTALWCAERGGQAAVQAWIRHAREACGKPGLSAVS